jgi:16S rRNA processing protein RimM
MPSSNDELPVGRIAGVFGIHGELKCDPTSAGRTLFSRGEQFRLQFADGASRDVEIGSVREHKNRLLLRLVGVDSANDAQEYTGATFYASAHRIILEPGEYLDRDLIGCRLYDEQGKDLGIVSAVDHFPSSDMLIVRGKMVPMIREFIKSIDIAAKRIVADLPPGLLDDEQAERG